MQKVEIADIQIKDGVGKKGPWKLTTLLNEKGARFSTFDHKARDLNVGDVVELEPIIEGEYINFSEWNLISETVTPQAPVSDKMSKQDWADKDVQKTSSINRNVAMYILDKQIRENKEDVPGVLGLSFWATLREYMGCQGPPPVKLHEPITADDLDFGETVTVNTIGDLLTWVATHGNKKYNSTWFWNNTSITKEEASNPAKLAEAFLEIKEIAGW